MRIRFYNDWNTTKYYIFFGLLDFYYTNGVDSYCFGFRILNFRLEVFKKP